MGALNRPSVDVSVLQESLALRTLGVSISTSDKCGDERGVVLVKAAIRVEFWPLNCSAPLVLQEHEALRLDLERDVAFGASSCG